MSNLAARFVVCLTFVLIVCAFRDHDAAAAGIIWGMSLLAALTWVLAHYRRASALSEVGKHLGVALIVLLVSRGVGHWISLFIA